MPSEIFTHSKGDIRVNYTVTQDIVNNKSTITITSIEFRSKSWYGVTYVGEGGLYINGTEVVNFTNDTAYSCYVGAVNTWYTISNSAGSQSIVVTHNADGTGSFKMFPKNSSSFPNHHDFNMYCLSGGSGNTNYNENRTVSLPTIDRTAPTVSVSASPVSTTSLKITVSATAACEAWWYRISGSSWVEFTPTNGSYTITGMTTEANTVEVAARKTSNKVIGYSASAAYDLTLPTVSLTVSNIGVYGFKISASANTTCDRWEYKIDNGNWTSFSTASGTSASITLSNLNPNTTYSVTVRARKAANGFYGNSAAQSKKTLGPSTLNSASTFAIDVALPVAPINITVYGALYHKLEIRRQDDTVIIAHSLGQLSVRTDSAMNVQLTAAERTTLLNAMTTVKTLNAKICLVTYTDAQYQNNIGSSVVNNVAITTSAAISAPTWSGFTYEDTETDVVAVTGDDQILVQSLSHLVVTAAAATAKNGASITGYTMNIGDISLQSSGTVLDAGVISSFGNLTLTVTVMDSREYSVSVSVVVKVLPYSYPSISQLLLRRRNEIDDIVQLTMAGSVPSIKPDSTELNAIEAVYFKYKKTSDETYTTVDLTNLVTIYGLTFSYNETQLLSLDKSSSYDFIFYVEDSFGDLTLLEYATILNQGTPIVSLRKRTTTNNRPRVGINNPSPAYELDVHGDIAMHDKIVQGYVGDLTDEYLSNIKSGGYYIQPDPSEATTQRGYPVAGKAGLLEVLAGGSNLVLQRYTFFDLSSSFIRHYDGSSWSSWNEAGGGGSIQTPVAIPDGGTGATGAAGASDNLLTAYLGSPQTEIPSGSDLNDYKTPGSNFYVASSSVASTIVHGPATGAGYKLIVCYVTGSSNIRQIVLVNGGNDTYSRHYQKSSGLWTSWGMLLDTNDLPLSIANGGFGGTTAAAARTNLDLANVYAKESIAVGDVGTAAKTITLVSTAYQPCLIVTEGVSTSRHGLYIVALRRTSAPVVTPVVSASGVTITTATGSITLTGASANTFCYLIPLSNTLKDNIQIT